MNGSPLVLVVDDDDDILMLVSYRLEREGYEVAHARDGHEALRVAAARAPDVIVLDVMMPGPDGYEVTRRLREAEATRATPIVLLTARAEETDVARGLAAGADDYVKKPFSPSALADRVQLLLAGRDDYASDAAGGGR